MSNKSTIFYRGNTAVSVDFSAEEISSDGAVVLLEKIEREHKLLRYYSSYIPDHPSSPIDYPHHREITQTTCLHAYARLSRCQRCFSLTT